jgi:hypothetical protein
MQLSMASQSVFQTAYHNQSRINQNKFAVTAEATPAQHCEETCVINVYHLYKE